jgi:crotonobetainyl-CoA:carnitine CoA-transferase CaiB-like acyl-CoA transferase
VFCESVLHHPQLAGNLLYRTNVDRCANRKVMEAEIGACFSALTRAEVRERLVSAGIAFGEVNDLAGLSDHPQLRRCTVQTPSGPVSLVSPAAISGNDPVRLRPVPALGEQNAAIRAEFSTHGETRGRSS